MLILPIRLNYLDTEGGGSVCGMCLGFFKRAPNL